MCDNHPNRRDARVALQSAQRNHRRRKFAQIRSAMAAVGGLIWRLSLTFGASLHRFTSRWNFPNSTRRFQKGEALTLHSPPGLLSAGLASAG